MTDHAAPPDIRAVIFDCDGTLVDSEPLLLRSLIDLAVRHGLPPSVSAELADIEGRSMRACVEMLEARRGRPFDGDFEAELRAESARVFRAELREIPGAAEMLRTLGLPFCIASNGPREKIELVLEVAGLLPLVGGRIHSAYEVGSFKPEPGLFLHAARAMGVAPAHCAVVEDSLAGIRAGLDAGMHVYAYRALHALPDALRPRVRRVERLVDLPVMLRRPLSGR